MPKGPRPMTRVENLLRSIAVMSEDKQIDSLVDEALEIITPQDKSTGRKDGSRKRKRPAKKSATKKVAT